MTNTPQPIAGSLEAKIIRACSKHQNKCKLDCPRRKVEELGQIASFNIGEQSDERGFSWRHWFQTRVKQ
jgi:hypothetical protein